jgi:hypothetical protein
MANYYQDDLRFLKRKNTKNTRDVIASNISDYIRSFGVDVVYYRRNYRFFNPDIAESGKADPIYGADPTAKFTIKASMVVFMEVLADSYLLNRFGIQNESEIQIYIGIRDFVETFKPLIGNQIGRLYGIPMKAKVGDRVISAVLDTPEIYGELRAELPISYDGVSEVTLTDIEFIPKSRPKNVLYHKAHTYDFVGVNYSKFTAKLSINLSNDTISGTATGVVSHFANESENQVTEHQIRPQPGDFFRLDNEELPDEYEITRIIDRAYAGTAYNPFFDKYAYICSCVRRSPSYEKFDIKKTIPGDADSIFNPPSGLFGEEIHEFTEEPGTVKKDSQGKSVEDAAVGIFNYTSSDEHADSDKAYGGYQSR